jgi:diguanylate cyclase (GGDEF)-like protein/PAS domain S-box-containing protein
MRQLLHTLLGRLSVGRKLLLIFMLDMTAVAFVSGIMINEKYLAIDFARKEQAGQAYIGALREGLLTLSGAVIEPPAAGAWTHHAGAVEGAESAQGRDMGSAEPARDYAGALRALGEPQREPGATTPSAALQRALEQGRALVTRVGNQSNLILDPDLDSYYTMSIVVLRVPELLEVSAALSAETLQGLRRGAPDDAARTRFLLLEGRLDAVTQGLTSDYAEAYAAASQPGMRAAMEPSERKLLEAIALLRTAARAAAAGETQADAASLAAFTAMHQGLIGASGDAWRAAAGQLDVLLQARIDGFFARMWLHLGTALTLLGLILSAVYFVATQIANPLKHLASVMDAVAVSGDHALRARWDSRDEIGRLVRGFNGMLAQLDRGRALQQELAASARAAEAQRELVEALPIPMMVTSVPSHQVLHANLPAQRWLGPHRDNPWQHSLEPAVRVRFFQQLFDRDAVDEFEVRWQAGGETSWAVLSARRLTYQGQDAVLTAFTPINHLKHMERRLELWAKVFQASSEGILIIDAERHVLTANRAFCQATLYELYDLVGDAPLFFDMGAGPQAFLDGLWPEVDQRGSWQGEVRMRRRDGREYPAWLMISVVREKPATAARGVQQELPPASHKHAVSHYIAITIDISDRKRHEDRIRFLARHDVLTELPNRSLCNERLAEALDAARSDGSRVAVLFIDLDRFKTINDTLGHHVGDGLLRSIAKRLLEAVRGSDTVCRLGGDEFVIILRGVVDSKEVAHVVSERLVPRIRAPHDVEGAELHVSCSVGVALYPDDAGDSDTLMRHADAAMYQAKASGRDAARFFTSELNERAQHRLRIETLLRHAVERGELALVVQPRVDARSHAVVGVEALLRWHSAELGEVEPTEFIAVAEECGLIMPIGRWVIDTACALQATWRGAGLAAVPIAINVSALQLRDGSLPRHLAEAMAAHGVPPGALEVELTESTLMDGAEAILTQLREIRALGVTLAIDDFGTGYSSLQYLNRFPIDRLKVDRSFVQDMLDDSTDHAIARGIISLGHTLGLRVVAEGVEHERIARALLACGCDELQGFHYGQPMPPDVFVAWLAAREATALSAEAA